MIVAIWLFESMVYRTVMNMCEGPMVFVITECKD